MKKKAVIALFGVAVLVATGGLLGMLMAKERNVASTTAPAATPSAQPTIAPTAPATAAMTAEEFYEKLHKNPDDFRNGTAIVITGIVASKSEDNIRFVVPWVDFTRGELKFLILLELNKNELAKVKIGETITVKGKMGGHMLHQWAYISNGRLQ